MPTYPINLLLRGRSGLVVGGGRVASGKVARLLEAGAAVSVVAREASAAIRRLAAAGALTLHERAFAVADLDGCRFVVAATDDRALNARIVAVARARGLLVCAVDENWPDGDFITPAVARRGGMTVAVSSDGLAHRKSKLLIRAFRKHLDNLECSALVVLGVDHHELPLAAREAFAFAAGRREQLAGLLRRVDGMQEFMLLSTCNRSELVAIAPDDPETLALLRLILGFGGDAQAYAGYAAFEHLALVAAGLRSQTPGERHIVAQLKAAGQAAEAAGDAGTMLRSLLDGVISTSREVRQTVEPRLRPAELEELVVKLIREKAPAARRFTVLGSGELGRALAHELAALGGVAVGYHRVRPAAGTVFPLAELEKNLGDAPVIVAALETAQPVLTPAHRALLPAGALLIDLGLPRNIAPELGETFTLLNLDDVKHWYRRNGCDLDRVVAEAAAVIQNFRKYYDKLEASWRAP